MNILNKFTIQNLKLNKKRTIVTIIGVALSTALICAVAGMITSFQKTLIDMEISQDGNYHVCFENVPENEFKYITDNTEVASYYCTKNIGWADLIGSKNEYKPYIEIREYDKSALENGAVKLIEGRLPENENEIIIPEHIKTNARVDFKIGDSVTFNIGTRESSDGTILDQTNPYMSSQNPETGEVLSEKIVDTQTKTYKIVGVIERINYETENYSSPGYLAITYTNKVSDKANISVLFKNPKKYADVTKQIKETIKNDTNLEIKSTTHTELLSFLGVVSGNILNVLYGLAGIIIGIIVISSVFVIRNSFNISVSEKNRQYGMMTSIGATSRQIKKSVLFEGFLIGVVAIPIGIICGIIAIVVLLLLVNYLLKDMLDGMKFIYSVPILPILFSIIISSITIFLSSIIPAIKASKISPIDAIRGSKDIKIKSKKIKTSKLVKKVFGIGGIIASKNLKRSKKKYRTTVISIVVSIVIFISLASFIQYGKKMTNMYYVDLKHNIEIYPGESTNLEEVELYKKISQFDNVDEFNYSYSYYANIDMDKYGTEYGKKYYNENVEKEKDENNTAVLFIVELNNEYFKKYIKDLGLNENNYKDIVILSDNTVEYNDDNTKTIQNFFNLNSGDSMTISIDKKNVDIKIDKKTDKKPMGFEASALESGYLFVSEDFFEDKSPRELGAMNINSSNATQVENALSDLSKENSEFANLNLTNFETYAKQSNRMILVVAIFLYGFISVISLIGITNIFNTISTNMILRSKEFAMLKSVGMTSGEFNKMIRLESILYGLKALIIGIPLGLIGSYLVYKSFAEGTDFGFIIPWTPIIISIIFVFIIVGITMKYSLNKINKQNIIETIRKDNI